MFRISVFLTGLFLFANTTIAGEATVTFKPTSNPLIVKFDDPDFKQFAMNANCSYYDHNTPASWFNFTGTAALKLSIISPSEETSTDFVLTNTHFPRHDAWISHAHEFVFSKKDWSCDVASGAKIEIVELIYESTKNPNYLLLVEINFVTKAIKIVPNVNAHAYTMIGKLK